MSTDNNIITIAALSSFTELGSTNKLNRTDVFIFFKETPDDPIYNFSSNIISHENFSKQIFNSIKFDSELKIVTNFPWFFKDKKSEITFSSKNISDFIDISAYNIPINLDYFEKNIASKIYSLSSEIFNTTMSLDDKHLPSIPGQIITSSTLSTISMVKAVYGQNTEWTQLYGQSILGIGEISPNNTDTWGSISSTNNNKLVVYSQTSNLSTEVEGKNKVKLETYNIPSHKHEFKSTYYEIPIDCHLTFINSTNSANFLTTSTNNYLSNTNNWGIFGLIDKPMGVQGLKWTTATSNNMSNSTNFVAVKSTDISSNDKTSWKAGTIGILNNVFEVSIKISTGNITGSRYSYNDPDKSERLVEQGTSILLDTIYDFNTGNLYATSNKLQGIKENDSHSNLPPYVTKFIWKREK